MKTLARQARHDRVRSRIQGTAERPRLVVFRGAKVFSLQLVDDTARQTLFTVTSPGGKTAGAAVAAKLGADLAKQAKTKKISAAVFDRAGYQYHGNVKAAVEAFREGGVKV